MNKKFFKVFIYLSDVSHNAGPHSFVVKTNTNRKGETVLREIDI